MTLRSSGYCHRVGAGPTSLGPDAVQVIRILSLLPLVDSVVGLALLD